MAYRLATGSRLVASVLLALVVVGCAGSGGVDEATVVPPPAPAPVPEGGGSGTSAPPPCLPAPLAARAAAVLMVGIGDATHAEDPLAAEVATMGVGGVVLLGPNVVEADQVRNLIAGLRRQAPRGLLVGVDEEGGRVSRLRPLIGATPSARDLGRQPLPEITDVGAERGTQLSDLGFDLVLGPVFDADGGTAGGAIGDRAFAAMPAEAGLRAAAYVEGLERSGMAATAKHFPGQGELGDSHDGPVVFDAPLDQVETLASVAFRPALSAGAPAMMMSHVTFPALGPRPASAEPGAYQLLRSLGFDGVAVTDAMNMSAVARLWPVAEATVMALVAGADLVLATPGQDATEMRDAVVAAVEEGRLSEDRLDEAVGRVLALRHEDRSTLVCG